MAHQSLVVRPSVKGLVTLEYNTHLQYLHSHRIGIFQGTQQGTLEVLCVIQRLANLRTYEQRVGCVIPEANIIYPQERQ